MGIKKTVTHSLNFIHNFIYKREMSSFIILRESYLQFYDRLICWQDSFLNQTYTINYYMYIWWTCSFYTIYTVY